MEFLRRSRENKNLRQRIANLNELSPRQVNMREVNKLHAADSQSMTIPPLKSKYIGAGMNLRVMSERFQQFGQLAETLGDLPPTLFSYGLFAPSYQKGLEYDTNRDATPRHRSLLAGALTEDTVREYAAVVEGVYPQSERYTIDLDTQGEIPQKLDPQTSHFAYADAMALPFANDVFDSIHTNILLSHLESGDNNDNLNNQNNILSEAHRTLAPEGVLLMVEEEENIDYANLFSAGFSEIAHFPALVFTSRRKMERAVHDRKISKPNDIQANERIQLVVAKK